MSVTVANRDNVEDAVILSYPNSGLGHVSQGELVLFDKSKTTVTIPINATGDELRIYTQGYEDDGNHWYDRNDPLGSLFRTYHVSLSGESSDTCFTETSNTGDFTLAYQIKDDTTPDVVCPLP